IAVNAAVFAFIFRRPLRQGYSLDWRRELATALPDRRLAGRVGGGLLAVIAAYLLASAEGWPIGLVAAAGGCGLAGLGLAGGGFERRRVVAHVTPSLFLYIAGLFVLVRGVTGVGLSGALAGALSQLAAGPVSAVLAGLVGGALGSNLVNNFPATLVLLSALQGHLAAHLQVPYAFGVLTGADLGPNLTPVGSLSTMLWLIIVRRRGLEISSLDYLKLGAAVTPLMLALAFALLALGFR
ncbi:MAG: ArsB/NhaD family transporter, partial [Candidatus Dormibacteraceae bacterium]